MDMWPLCAQVLLGCGVAVLLLSALALLVLPGTYARLHALALAAFVPDADESRRAWAAPPAS
ncbi:hypothetical protein ACFRCI_49190 [Streptomyces sp. NPDC056638]|uniref:hypothetical protein n=1 Tax=unclassified Streptomyces TaxID=2593676 RepID=UPI0036CBA9C3